MDIKDTISILEDRILDPCDGLPEDVFLFVSRLTPMVNVDLLIKDENSRTLLSWRDDPFAGQGWHIPGGIVRFKESFERRLQAVAETEIGTSIQYDPAPIAINQIVCQSRSRGHFISVLYRCFLSSQFVLDNGDLSEQESGYLKWHASCPPNLVNVHAQLYKPYINDVNGLCSTGIGYQELHQ